ncbi:MAG: insulinase family protein, partial [Chloroflexi bacterium]|nr:insulinase family protein [Chloroflexota bacterium]
TTGPLAILDVRPRPGPPREYRFPAFERVRIANGLTVITAHLPGRPLLNAQLVFPGGAAIEPRDRAGVTVLTARGMTEGTARRDAIELIEATERLGADLEAEAGWESLVAGISVPRSRFAAALALLAEVVLEPGFPESEVDRLRDERVNDLMQARADPRRRIERVFPEIIYDAATPYSRPLAGTEMTVPELGRAEVIATHARLADPSGATFVLAGDLTGLDVPRLVEAAFDAWQPAASSDQSYPTNANLAGPRVVVVDRPGSPQSEVRIGHVGIPRSTPDFHAVSVLNTILGGQFSSRLNQLLREDRGYTYGVHSSFDMRRGPGPFVIRMAVETDVTAAAVGDALGELDRIREAPVQPHELERARDYLVGVFPLRFEAAPQVATAIAGLVVHDLPDDELDRYRPAIAAVGADEVLAAARAHIRPDEASIVIVGDAARFADALGGLGRGDVTVLRDDPAPDPAA